MPEDPDVLEEALRRSINPGARGRLLARGLARGMIWRDGEVPAGGPQFGPDLTDDLLDHGFGILSRALRLRESGGDPSLIDDSFRVAAESIEAAVRRGDPADPARGFRLMVAAVAFHLASFSARSYSLLGGDVDQLNLTSDEILVALLMRRSLPELRARCTEWLGDDAHTDTALASASANGGTDTIDALQIALSRNLHRAVGFVDSALLNGSPDELAAAVELLDQGRTVAAETGIIDSWWVHVLARHLIDDLWGHSLWRRLPEDDAPGGAGRWSELRGDFIDVLSSRPNAEVTLWPSQLEAAQRATDRDDDLVVALPTSAGKTRIAELCVLRALADERRTIYVTPLRALSAQLERVLTRTFRPLGVRVSSLYGASGVARADIHALETAQVVVATPEKLDFALRQQPELLDDVGLIVLDEGHMIGIDEREVRYEALVQRLLSRDDSQQRRIVCLSAIFGQGEVTADFVKWIRSDADGDGIESSWRPTRHRPAYLDWNGSRGRLVVKVEDEEPFIPTFVQSIAAPPPRRRPFPADDKELTLAVADRFVAQGGRVLLYCPERRTVDPTGKALIDLITRGLLDPYPITGDIGRALAIGREWLGEDHIAYQALQRGIAVHHGALPRAFLAELESLLDSRTLRYVIASPTVAQGLDLAASILVFRSIHRSGQVIDDEEYRNVVGRVGRAFVDLDGVSVLAVDRRTSRGERKFQAYRRMVRGTQPRTLESGIYLLISKILESAAAATTSDVERAIEYLLNQGSNWELPGVDAAAAREFEELVASLDAAILSTVEDPDLSTGELADAIDAALRSSLWRRTITRRDPSELDRQQRLLLGRAEWIWERTTQGQRRGFFAAAIGFQAGSLIDEHLDALLEALTSAEDALSRGDVPAAAERLVSFARIVMMTRPFAPSESPDDWPALLAAWMAGSSVADPRQEAVTFIQDGLVYRLVWAAEAVRTYAEVLERPEADQLSGACSMALTYGVPDAPAAELIRRGLPSRLLAEDISTRFPVQAFETDLDDWVDGLANRINTTDFDDPAMSGLWTDFSTSSADRVRRWVRTAEAHGVSWLVAPPPAGTSLRLIPRDGETLVCTPDLVPIGTVEIATPGGWLRGSVLDHDQLSVERFGPAR